MLVMRSLNAILKHIVTYSISSYASSTNISPLFHLCLDDYSLKHILRSLKHTV